MTNIKDCTHLQFFIKICITPQTSTEPYSARSVYHNFILFNNINGVSNNYRATVCGKDSSPIWMASTKILHKFPSPLPQYPKCRFCNSLEPDVPITSQKTKCHPLPLVTGQCAVQPHREHLVCVWRVDHILDAPSTKVMGLHLHSAVLITHTHTMK